MKPSSGQNPIQDIQYIQNSITETIRIDSALLKIIYNTKRHRCICNLKLRNLRYKIVLNTNPKARQKGVAITFSKPLELTGYDDSDLTFILYMINKIDTEYSFYKKMFSYDDWLHQFIKDNAANLLSNSNNRKSMPYNLSVALAERFRTEEQIEDEFRAKEIAIGLIILDEIRKMDASEIGLIK